MRQDHSQIFLHIRRIGNNYATIGETIGMRGHKIGGPRSQTDDGIFVEWLWDGDKLQVRNDRYGMQPLFYFADENQVAISNSILRLLEAGASRELDDAALAAALRIGFFLGEDTPFRAIRAIPPQATLEWRDGRLKMTGGITIAPRREMSRKAAMEAYIDLFRAAIKRRPPSHHPVIVPLSGGRDSRHIVLELCHQGIRPHHCVTARSFPWPVIKTECEAASQLCQSLGLRQITLDQPESRLEAEIRKNLMTDFCAFEHSWFGVVADYLKNHAGTVYDGIGGDVLSAGLFLTKERIEHFERERFAELADDLFPATSDRAILRLLRPELARRFNREVAFERFKVECRQHLAAANQVGSFHFWNRTRRLIALCPYGMLRDVPEVFSPYLDRELFDLLASLPARLFADYTFHTETIKLAYSEYAEIPFAESRHSDENYQEHYQQLARETIRYLLQTGGRRWMRGRYLIPRLIRPLIFSGDSTNVEWLATSALYYAQLSEVAEESPVV